MPTIILKTEIRAPKHLVFDLSRDVDFHQRSTAHTGEKAIAGVTSGLLNKGDSVTWRAKHLGVWQNLTSQITEMDSPHRFVDEMVQGAFASFTHEHLFESSSSDSEVTIMTDTFEYTSPFGILGKLVDVLFLKNYMTRLLQTRNQILKSEAENQ
ncbi:MAG: hypothetical protein SchgKO_06230 [Schleiferiaceae bacterium]